METYGSIPSMDAIMREENKKKNRCCIFCCVMVIVVIGLIGWTMTTWNFIKPNFNTLWKSTHLKSNIVNELYHPLAIQAEIDVRHALEEKKGHVMDDHDFRKYYDHEKACCEQKCCDICADINWYCCNQNDAIDNNK